MMFPVQKLGQRLIDLPYGLNALESGLSESEEVLIAFMAVEVRDMNGYIP